MEFHEAANIFPLDEATIDALAEDIQQQGQQVSIELLGGKIVDGRRRWLACQKAGVQPKTRDVNVHDPVAYVLSLNLHRRHLSPGQLAMVGARAREIYDRQAKERMRAGGKAAGKSRPQQGPANLPEPNQGDARDQVGKVVGVSGKSIDYGTQVLEKGVPELIAAVDEGRLAVSTAAILASEPAAVQRAEVADPKRQRLYTSVRKPRFQAPPEPEELPEGAPRGVGVFRAHEAINCLIRIPQNDALRKRGFQIVTDWIKANR